MRCTLEHNDVLFIFPETQISEATSDKITFLYAHAEVIGKGAQCCSPDSCYSPFSKMAFPARRLWSGFELDQSAHLWVITDKTNGWRKWATRLGWEDTLIRHYVIKLLLKHNQQQKNPEQSMRQLETVFGWRVTRITACCGGVYPFLLGMWKMLTECRADPQCGDIPSMCC